MEKQNMQPSDGPKHGNDPRKNDPTKQDERDNDATRIRPEKEKQERPEEPSSNPSTGSSNKEIEEPEKGEPYKRTPDHKQAPVAEPDKQTGVNKDYNPAAPQNKRDATTEQDDSGNPVMRNFGNGL
jgi:hypothetical protein